MRKLQTFWQNLHLRAKFLLILLVGIVIIGVDAIATLLIPLIEAWLKMATGRTAYGREKSYSRSRRIAVSFLESARPAIGLRGSKITAAATTGPAKGPRPASSTPAIRPTASTGHSRSS